VDQAKRISKLQEISDAVEISWLKKWDDEKTRKAIKEIKATAYELTPFSLSDLPPEVREPFIATDGSGDYLVYLYDLGGKADGRKAMKFSDSVEQFKKDAGMFPILSGQEIIFADIVRRVIREGPWLVIGMFILVFLICWFDLKNIAYAAITLSPVVFGFLLTGFFLVVSGTQINFYNMVALASLGAMVVDNSIHLFHRYLGYRNEEITYPARRASFAVSPTIVTCTITSICGYGGMVFATHTGIASLGLVAVLGLTSCLIAAVFFFPPWLSRYRP